MNGYHFGVACLYSSNVIDTVGKSLHLKQLSARATMMYEVEILVQ